MMTGFHAERALTQAGWRGNVRLTVSGGAIAALEDGAAPRSSDERCAILLPAMPNLHSHAFQRGMAGLAETRGPGADSFWSWRETMYRFAHAMTPDDVEAVAAQAYVEMLEAGFSRVGEFHYLHHDLDGRPYAEPAAMAAAVASAASHTGIGLTLLPVFYAQGGFGGAAPNRGQRRFVSDRDGFWRLLDGCAAAIRALPTAVLGLAAHSLRAVTPEDLVWAAALRPGHPLHIHVAEQEREVEDCLAWSGQRPVAWLLDHADVDRRWCLVHATHLDAAEIAGLSACGAAVGLCPVTEANLGDGIFPGRAFRGPIGIGTDSNVLIGVSDELRQLEYSQRLALRSRNVLTRPGESTARALFDSALAGGAQALGCASPHLRVGAPADFVSLDASHPALAGKIGDRILDAWVFAASRPAIDGVWVAGRRVVKAGRHRARDAVVRRFRTTIERLSASA